MIDVLRTPIAGIGGPTPEHKAEVLARAFRGFELGRERGLVTGANPYGVGHPWHPDTPSPACWVPRRVGGKP